MKDENSKEQQELSPIAEALESVREIVHYNPEDMLFSELRQTVKARYTALMQLTSQDPELKNLYSQRNSQILKHMRYLTVTDVLETETDKPLTPVEILKRNEYARWKIPLHQLVIQGVLRINPVPYPLIFRGGTKAFYRDFYMIDGIDGRKGEEDSKLWKEYGPIVPAHQGAITNYVTVLGNLISTQEEYEFLHQVVVQDYWRDDVKRGFLHLYRNQVGLRKVYELVGIQHSKNPTLGEKIAKTVGTARRQIFGSTEKAIPSNTNES